MHANFLLSNVCGEPLLLHLAEAYILCNSYGRRPILQTPILLTKLCLDVFL